MYRVHEVGDLFVDTCVREPDSGALRFLSIYGRDGALLKFFASFSLPQPQGGLSEFTLLSEDGARELVRVPEPSRLHKLTGKFPRGNLFGSLAHAWLYDPCVSQPDRANATAWGLYPCRDGDGPPGDDGANAAEVGDRLWQQVRDLSPVPLADEWRAVLMANHGMPFVRWLRAGACAFAPLGPIQACRITLDEAFVRHVSSLVKKGVLGAPTT
jgi:hypothetical protein